MDISNFSKDQKFIYDKYISGNNLFITGPGGCGKSYIIKKIVYDAKQKGTNIAVCALTGCAAYLLDCGATTLHKWTQLGLGNRSFDDNIRYIYNNLKRRKLWASTQLLIIDEVSMMSKYMFNLLDAIGKKVHNNNKPFGGIQLIFSGDFYQLPPIRNNIDITTKDFCFESDNWNNTFDFQIHLNKVFRQDNDTFIKILYQIRKGEITKESIDILENRIQEIKGDIIKPIILTPLRNTANNINNTKLSELKTESNTYTYQQYINYNNTNNNTNNNFNKAGALTKAIITKEVDYLLKTRNIDSTIILKIGCQVMCTVNIDVNLGITNGSIGVITEFRNGYPVIKFKNGIIYHMLKHKWMNEDGIIGVLQLPLILAWAITIHKSQGATLEYAQMDLGSDVFTDGQIYVALSRIKSLDNLYLLDFDYKKIKANGKVKKYYSSPLLLNIE